MERNPRRPAPQPLGPPIERPKLFQQTPGPSIHKCQSLKNTLETQNDEAIQLMQIVTEGKRLKDISDLPLDLVI
ncbi:MAG: hypothetical protein JJT75_04300 [Opitutales bacterium]|nr:hypothetical protein [Opitutales bacterium]